MVRMIRVALRTLTLVVFVGGIAWQAPAQTTNYSISAGSGTLTYTETVSTSGTCPVGSPTGTQEPITQSLFNTFAYNTQSLSGSVAYVNSPGGSYCPTSGWQGPIPVVLTGSNYEVFFTPSLSGAGTATLDAITVSAVPTSSIYGGSVTFTATEAYPGATGTVTFFDGSTSIATASMSNKVATFSTSSLSAVTHSITAAFSGSAPSETSPPLSFTVSKATPGASVSCSPNPVSYVSSGGGTLTTCTATVNAPGSVANVALTYNGNAWTTIPLSNDSVSASGFSPGTTAQSFTITASYAGDSNYNAVNASTTFTISKVTPAASLSCSPNPVTYIASGSGTLTTCTATVNAPGSTANVVLTYNGNSWTTIPLSNDSISASGFNPGTGAQSFTITAAYAGDGNYNAVSASTTFTISKASQSITFTAPASPISYGVSRIALSGSASSGLGVAFSILSGPGSISGSTLTITGVGTVVVAANQAGNTNYTAAAQVTQSVVVNQAAQTINFTAPSTPVTYGVSPVALSAFGGGSGNAVIFSVASGPASVSGSTLTISGAGTVVVAANQAGNANYTAAAQVTHSIVVNQASQAINFTAPSTPVTYGVSPVALSASGGGSGNAVIFSVVSGPASVSGSTLTISGAGTIVVAANQAASTNYAAAPQVTHSITVNKAGLTVTANSFIRAYAAANPAFTVSYNGFVNGNTQTVLSGSPSLTTTAGSTSVVGSYAITAAVGSLSAANYSFSFVNGTLTVTKATLSITWPTPSAVPNGKFLGPIQLNATTTVPGTFAYSPATGTMMTPGIQRITATFTPTDTVDYNAATASVSLTVSMAPATGIITTVAGTNLAGYLGDTGPAISAELSEPQGIAVDTSGNIYIADTSNSVVRKIAANTGVITTFAGNGTQGYSGDNSAATQAALNLPFGVAVDSANNVYIADTMNNVIRKVSTSGVITTFAGNGTPAFAGDGGQAIHASLYAPYGVAVDGSGNVYIADTDNWRIREVNASGVINTIAGSATWGYTGDGGSPTLATLNSPQGVAVDSAGNIYIADTNNQVIRKVSSSKISTFAGNGTKGYAGDGGAATAANLNYPGGVNVDTGGNVYIADTNNNAIRKVSSSTHIISDAGVGTNGYTGDGGPAIDAQLYAPYGVALDSASNLYLADTYNDVIRAVGAGPITPLIVWPPPMPIVYGTALSSVQLNATSTVAGTFAYSPASGTVPLSGQQALGVTFTPSDTTDYTSATDWVPLTVSQATPLITWATPAAVAEGTTLSSTQLNATSSVGGTFAYSPASGTVLTSGPHLLTAVFTPTNTTDYAVTAASVSIDVQTGTHKQDSGTIALLVNTGSGYITAVSTPYSAGATPSSIARGLAAGTLQTETITVSAVNDQVTIVSTGTGAAANYPYMIETTAWDSTDFPGGPSFPTVSGVLDGGAAATTGSSPQTIYSFGYTGATVYDGAGNLTTYADSVMGNWNDTYDTLNGLVTGSASSGNYNAKNFCWAYDAFGNRTMQTMLTASCTSGMTPTANYATNNQLSSALYHYDQAGDVDVDPQNQYLYDAEGRLCAVSAPNGFGGVTMTGYLYDADGTRVSKGAIQAWSCNPTSSQYVTTSDYILGSGGEQMSEYTMSNGTMAWQHTNVWAAGRLIATYAQDDTVKNGTATDSGLLHFYFDDPLGTRRAQTDYSGRLEQTCLSLPYGDGESCATSPTEHLFTGKERDSESGNDYFEARYYSSAMGRFMSPDWSAKVEPVPYAKLDNPQSLNLYAYVGNNPLTRTDPDGHGCVTIFGRAFCMGAPPPLPPPPPTPAAPGGPPMKGVNPVTGQTLFSPNPKGQSGNERPGVGGAGNFGACRGTGCSRTHQGEDISAPVGTDIHAATGGTVTFSGVSGSQTTGYGNTIKVDDGSGTVTVYSHNSDNGVSVGDKVQRGDVIGTSGQTGNAAGQPASEAHVHFEVQVNGQRVDPATWLNSATQ